MESSSRQDTFEQGRLQGKRELAEVFLLGKYHPQITEARIEMLQRIISHLPKLNLSQLDALLVAEGELFGLEELDEWLRAEIKTPRCHALNVKQLVSSKRWVKMKP
jgi:hypothetical protein